MSLASILNKEIARKRKNQEDKSQTKKLKTDINITNNEISTEKQPAEKYTPKQLQLINSISDDDLKLQLQEFDSYTETMSKLDKIRLLKRLKKQRDKQQRYKLQRDKERNINDTIDINQVTDLSRKQEALTQLRVYIKRLLTQWESLDKDQQQETLLYETKVDLVPLLYNLRNDGLTNDMIISLNTICYYLQKADYKRANESYMKLSIGNVAWPIGVIGVSHHSRSADLKITGDKNTANIMIDDKTRRWITGIKRLITVFENNKP